MCRSSSRLVCQLKCFIQFFTGDVSLLDTIPFNYRERHPRLFDMSLTSKKSIYQMQQTNPSILLEPGVDDDLIVFGRAKCNTDDDRFYDPQCYSYEGKVEIF